MIANRNGAATDHSGPAGGPRETIEEIVRSRLRKCHYPSLRRVACHERQGAIVLEGRVSSFYLKQVAQEIVKCAVDATPIENRIEVRDESTESN